jgi:hypothetical protein
MVDRLLLLPVFCCRARLLPGNAVCRVVVVHCGSIPRPILLLFGGRTLFSRVFRAGSHCADQIDDVGQIGVRHCDSSSMTWRKGESVPPTLFPASR